MTLEVIPRESEDQWLAERMKRVTATDIGRLANGGPAMWATIKREKAGERTFFGNKYTEWGHEREPVMLAHLSFLHGIEPNDALYVSGDRAATPDGISATALAEAKTTVRSWADLDELRAVKPEYYDQVQWAQLVCERDLTFFIFEPHENFQPLPVQIFEIPRDEEHLKHLVEVEAEFRDFLAQEDESGEWDAFMARYAVAEAELKEKQAEVDRLKQELRDKQGDTPLAAETPFGKISYSFPKPRKAFDTSGFKKAHGDLYDEFLKDGAPAEKATLRITVK